MPDRITAFGGSIRSEFWTTAGELDSIARGRVLWFDRDVDGRWLIWVAEDRDPQRFPMAETPLAIGALVVRDPMIGAFLEQLGQLLLQPDRFAHEPTVGE